MRGAPLIAASLLVAASCGTDGSSDPPAPTSETSRLGDTAAATDETTNVPVDETDPTALDGSEVRPLANVIDIPDAIAINLAGNGSDNPVVSWTTADDVLVARLDLDAFELGDPVVVSGDLTPVGHPIERPALSIGTDDIVHVAFTSLVGTSGSVYYVDLRDRVPTEPVPISGDPRPETNLVHMTPRDEAPALAWLEDSTLSVATQAGGTPTEVEGVDELTCDCCNPVPVRVGDQLIVAYRNQERTTEGIIRDVYAVTSPDGGSVFGEPVPIADDHWFLEGCPFSGPAVTTIGDDILAAWSDARQSVHPDQDATTIWVDRSSDGGASFGTDHAITDGGIHRWPTVAVDDRGTVHLLWETQATDGGGISSSSSDDNGVHFSPPELVIPNTPESGSRRSPSMIAHGDHLLVTWVDRTGGHVTAFEL